MRNLVSLALSLLGFFLILSQIPNITFVSWIVITVGVFIVFLGTLIGLDGKGGKDD